VPQKDTGKGAGHVNNETIMDNNRNYWNENADLWFGTTALPEYGVKFVTEDDLHLFGNISCRTKCRGIMGAGYLPKAAGSCEILIIRKWLCRKANMFAYGSRH
jgi:hypothetical protein